MVFINLGPQLAKIRVDNQMANSNTEPYGDPALKIKILKIGFVHARGDQNIGTKPTFQVPRSSNGKN